LHKIEVTVWIEKWNHMGRKNFAASQDEAKDDLKSE
jgi:hypothetical protein